MKEFFSLFSPYIKFFGNYEKMSTMRPHHLGTATNTYALVWNPDRIIHSESMTPEILTYILKGTHVRGEWLERTWSDAFEGTNHGGYAARGLLSVVMFSSCVSIFSTTTLSICIIYKAAIRCSIVETILFLS